MHFRRWKLYSEEALTRQPAVIWLHGDALTETPLAQYTVRYQSDKKHFKDVPEAKRFETPYRSLQGWLWNWTTSRRNWRNAFLIMLHGSDEKKSTLLQLALLEEPPATHAKIGHLLRNCSASIFQRPCRDL